MLKNRVQAVLWWIAITALLYSVAALNGVLKERQPHEKGD
jgi:hypothetical protein